MIFWVMEFLKILIRLKKLLKKIASLSGDVETAVVQKLADLGRRIDEFANLDLVATYNAAKA